MNFNRVKGVLVDISGVLFHDNATVGNVIDSSVKAIKRVQQSKLKLMLCSNETNLSRHDYLRVLKNYGFDVPECQLITPASVTINVLMRRRLRPYLLISKSLRPEFTGIDTSSPNCVVIGNAENELTYHNLNRAFQTLRSLDDPFLISMGYSKYYVSPDGMKLDVGAFAKLLEDTCDTKAEVLAKPTHEYFGSALQRMSLAPQEAVLISDDLYSDINGAKKFGMQTILVKTGRWTKDWERETFIIPSATFHNLHEAAMKLIPK